MYSSLTPSKYQRIFAILVVFIFLINLVFAYALLPTQEAKAQIKLGVITSNPLLQSIQSAWKAIDGAWQAADKLLQKVTSASSATSSAIDMWGQAKKILREATRWAITQLLYKLLATVSNDIIKWINGGQQVMFVTNWNQYLEGAALKNGLNPTLDNYLGQGLMCQSYDAAIKQAFSAQPNFAQQISCPVQSSNNQWDTWLQQIQPSGNFYGSYLETLDKTLADEEKARRAAEDEAISGGGFIGAKDCKQWRVENLISGEVTTVNGKSPGDLSGGDLQATCTNNQIITPPSVLQHEISQTTDSGRQLVQQQIAAMTPHLELFGINLAPFMSSLFTSLINKMINMGLGSLTGVSATADDTYYYSQLSNGPDLVNESNWPSDITANSTLEVLPMARQLLMQQRLLKENLENELMPQLTRQRDILAQMKQLQQNILTALVDVAKESPCTLPTWASKQILSSQTTNGATVETIKVTAIGVGDITFTNTIATTDIGESISVQISQVNPEISDPDKDVRETQQLIADVSAAISTTENYIAAAEDYQTVYSANASLTGAGGAAAIPAAENRVETAWNAMIAAAQKTTNSSSANLGSLVDPTQAQNLNLDTQNMNLRVVEQAANLQSELSNPESSIYQQQSALQQKGTEAQAAVTTCQQYLLQLQEERRQRQEQETTNPFGF